VRAEYRPPTCGSGAEHRSVAGLGRRLLQRGAGVGDDDDASGRVDAGLREGLLEHPALAVGLDRAAGLAGHHDHGAVELHERVADLARVGGVQGDQRHAVRRADHLGCQGRPAHAGQDHTVDALGAERVPQRLELGDQRAGRRGQRGPGQPDRRLLAGVGAPDVGVAGAGPGGDPGRDEPVERGLRPLGGDP
jgi:hypothetical protein